MRSAKRPGKRRKKKPKLVPARSVAAIAMHTRGGKGTHDGSKRAKRRRDRQEVKRELRG